MTGSGKCKRQKVEDLNAAASDKTGQPDESGTKEQECPLALSPQQYAEKLSETRAEAAALTKPFTECDVFEKGFAGQHCFLDASQRQNIRIVFQFYKELDMPDTSACILVPDWPNARFNHYLKDAQMLKQ